MNPFQFWSAITRRSVTFASAFALGVLHVGWHSGVKTVAGWFGVKGIAAFLIPFILLYTLARHEPQWIRDEALRRRLSIGILIASLIAAYGLHRLHTHQ